MKALSRFSGAYTRLRAIAFILPVVLIATAAGLDNDANSIPGALWIAKAQGVLKLSSRDGSILLKIPEAKKARALVVDPKRRLLWGFGQGELFAYTFDGVHKVTVTGLGSTLDLTVALAVDSVSGTVWLAAGRTLYRIAPSGQTLGTVSLPGQVPTLTVDQERSRVWVALASGLKRYDAGAAQRFTLSLPLITHVAVDAQSGLWAASLRRLYRIDFSGAVEFQLEPFPALGRGAVGRHYGYGGPILPIARCG